MKTPHNKVKSKIIENLPFCIQDTFLTYRPLYLHTFRQYLKRFGTTEKKMKTMSQKHALWRYLKQFGIAENKMKTRTVCTPDQISNMVPATVMKVTWQHTM